MKRFEAEKTYASRFEQEIKLLLANVFVVATPEQIDRTEAADLMILEVKPIRIGCRVRRFRYLEQYHNEFTIRNSRPNNNMTELAKIISGYGDYLFYGFANENDRNLCYAVLIDLKVFRLCYSMHLAAIAKNRNSRLSIVEKDNWDGSSRFCSFRYNDFPAELIVQCWNIGSDYEAYNNLPMASGF